MLASWREFLAALVLRCHGTEEKPPTSSLRLEFGLDNRRYHIYLSSLVCQPQ